MTTFLMMSTLHELSYFASCGIVIDICVFDHILATFFHDHYINLWLTSNKLVAIPRQDSIRPYGAHAVLSGYCNYYFHFSCVAKMLQNTV